MKMGMQTLRPLALSSIMLTVLLTGGVLSPRAATAATYYVATTGNDANGGTQAQPFRTIAKGLTVLRAGDTLYLRGGTYQEGIDTLQNAIPSGTSWSNPVTIGAYPGETVTLNAPVNINGYGSTVYQYIIVDGLILDGRGVNQVGVFIGGSNAHHIRVQNSEVKNHSKMGVQAYDTTDLEYIRLKVHDNGTDRLKHGFYIAIKNALIDECDIYNNSGLGIRIYNSSCTTNDCADNTTIRNSSIHDNRGDGGVTLNHGRNILFSNNLVYNNLNGVGVAYGNPTNTQIYNNTIYNHPQGDGISLTSVAASTVIKNNILYQNSRAIQDQGVGTVVSKNLTTDPKFMNAAANDFRLQATSPAIDAGIALSAVLTDLKGISRPQGAGYDIGAYEYQGIQLALPSPRDLKAVVP
jgi:hypothetical protein